MNYVQMFFTASHKKESKLFASWQKDAIKSLDHHRNWMSVSSVLSYSSSVLFICCNENFTPELQA